jgi:hypothetical protein
MLVVANCQRARSVVISNRCNLMDLACASPASGDVRHQVRSYGTAGVDPAEELLRRLALNDEKAVDMVLSGAPRSADAGLLPKVDLLVRLGALVAVGAPTASLRRACELAQAAGATDTEMVGVLVAVAPTVGLARVVATAPRLASAMGYVSTGDE